MTTTSPVSAPSGAVIVAAAVSRTPPGRSLPVTSSEEPAAPPASPPAGAAPGMPALPACPTTPETPPLRERVGARRQQAEVARDFEQVRSDRLDDAAHLDERIRILRGLQEILGACQSEAGHFPQVLDNPEDVLTRCANAGSDRSAAQVDGPQALLALVDPPSVPPEGLRVGRPDDR